MLGDEKGAGHIDGEDVVPLIEARLLDGFLDLDARGVDQDIEAARLGGDMLERRDNAGLAGDVDLQEILCRVPVLKRSARRQVGGEDTCALAQEARADGTADSAPPARHQGRLSLQHHA